MRTRLIRSGCWQSCWSPLQGSIVKELMQSEIFQVAASEACLELDASARTEGLHEHVRAEEVGVALDDAGLHPGEGNQLREVLQSKVANACNKGNF